MELLIFCSLRALVGPDGPHPSLAEALPGIVDAGYAGVLAPLSVAETIPDFRSQLGERGLDYVATVTTEGASVDDHIESFAAALADAEFHRPRLLIVRSGSPRLPDAERVEFFDAAVRVEEEAPYAVAHHTHRESMLGTPAVTERMVTRFPELRLSIDVGQWMWARGGSLDDDRDAIARCAEHAGHLWISVGDEHGPRVGDPSAADRSAQVTAHEGWWSLVWDVQRRVGDDVTIATPDDGGWETAAWLADRARALVAAR